MSNNEREENEIDQTTGRPIDKSYLEFGLPDWLVKFIEKLNVSWEKVDNGEECWSWERDWCELQSEINVAEVEQLISSEQAWYLREKYLRLRIDDDI